jgi:2,3-bisphosphoglycerate-dependent phosphoglycerate mutase
MQSRPQRAKSKQRSWLISWAAPRSNVSFRALLGERFNPSHRLRLPIETDPRLRERALSSSHLPNWRENLRQTFEQLDLCFPGGESSREAMQRASAAVHDILRKTPTGAIAIVSHGNLSTLLLKQFDATLGFSTWERMTTPDVFGLHLGEMGTRITRLWQADGRH